MAWLHLEELEIDYFFLSPVNISAVKLAPVTRRYSRVRIRKLFVKDLMRDLKINSFRLSANLFIYF